MGFLPTVLDLFLNLDKHLNEFVASYGALSYLILFLIIFCETGLVVTPFLPGDSLLFAAGALAATPGSPLHIVWLFLMLAVAAIVGDSLNYMIGSRMGARLFRSENSRIFNREYLRRTEAFYEKHGGKTIILARFVPIVRTFAPFVAGMGSMHYGRFISYNVIGGLLWVSVFLASGYLFGNIPFVQKNFELVALAIVLISVLPMVYEYARHRMAARKVPTATVAE